MACIIDDRFIDDHKRIFPEFNAWFRLPATVFYRCLTFATSVSERIDPFGANLENVLQKHLNASLTLQNVISIILSKFRCWVYFLAFLSLAILL